MQLGEVLTQRGEPARARYCARGAARLAARLPRETGALARSYELLFLLEQRAGNESRADRFRDLAVTEALAAGHAPSAMNDLVATERSERGSDLRSELSVSPANFRGSSNTQVKQQNSSGISLHRAPSSLSRTASIKGRPSSRAPLRRVSSAAPAGVRPSAAVLAASETVRDLVTSVKRSKTARVEPFAASTS